MNIKKEKVKNIIFDVGDVLLEYRWKEMLMDYGLEEEKAIELGNKIFEEPLWLELDLANRSVEDIIREYEKKFPEDAESIRWFITHGEYMHVKRPRVWKEVRRLKKQGYKIYLLSNYSEDLFKKHTFGADFLEDIHGKVVSYEVHMVKPNAEIYKYLCEKYQLKPEDCIFFDDRLENVEAAISLGMQSLQVTSEKALLEMLKELS